MPYILLPNSQMDHHILKTRNKTPRQKPQSSRHQDFPLQSSLISPSLPRGTERHYYSRGVDVRGLTIERPGAEKLEGGIGSVFSRVLRLRRRRFVAAHGVWCCLRHIVPGSCLQRVINALTLWGRRLPMRARWLTVTASSCPLSDRASFCRLA